MESPAFRCRPSMRPGGVARGSWGGPGGGGGGYRQLHMYLESSAGTEAIEHLWKSLGEGGVCSAAWWRGGAGASCNGPFSSLQCLLQHCGHEIDARCPGHHARLCNLSLPSCMTKALLPESECTLRVVSRGWAESQYQPRWQHQL